jgi:hypothetical protein
MAFRIFIAMGDRPSRYAGITPGGLLYRELQTVPTVVKSDDPSEIGSIRTSPCRQARK